jgi:hypothetical protein
MGLITLHVLKIFLFHYTEYKTLEASWYKLASLFGKVNEFRALQFKLELSLCLPNDNAFMGDYLKKFKFLVE